MVRFMRLRRPRAICGVFGDQVFAQSGQSDRKLDGRAGLRAARKRQFLVDHGQNAAAGGLDSEHGAIHVAQGIEGGLANDRIFAGGHIAVEVVVRERAGGETLVVAMRRWRRAGSHADGAGTAAREPGSGVSGRAESHLLFLSWISCGVNERVLTVAPIPNCRQDRQNECDQQSQHRKAFPGNH